MHVKIAMMQMRVAADDAAGNLDRAEQLLAGIHEPVDIAVFPECADIGWGNPRAAELAEPVPGGQTCLRWQALARKYGIYLAAGLTERDGARIFNSAILVDDQGQILLHHRKINELQDAAPLYAIGDRLGVVQTKFGVLALDICADNLPGSLVLGHCFGRMGAQLLLSPSAWAADPGEYTPERPYGENWHASYAQLSQLYRMAVVGVSNVGPVTCGVWQGKECIGNSIAYGPDGAPLAVLPYGMGAETVQVVDVTLGQPIAKGFDFAQTLRERGYQAGI